MALHTTFDHPRFAVADTISRRLAGLALADDAVLDAVATLTASAAPARAAQLAPRRNEPAVLVERLAIWALHRADDRAVAHAAARLGVPRSATTTPTADAEARQREPIAA